MKTLVVDCGASKTHWLLSDGKLIRTPGFNLAHTSAADLEPILADAARLLGQGIDTVYFYAAGLVGESPVDLGRWFPGARIHYASDMLGAARAVCGREKGIAAIVGTGANTCQWDGMQIVRKVNCGGYIIGDEGSASVLGKLFITDFLKGHMPKDIADDFAANFQADYPTIVKNVYSGSAPARYLGGFAPFILSYYNTSDYAKMLVDNNFRGFFERTVLKYDSLPLGIVGGFGYACREIIKALAVEYGVEISGICASPLEALMNYHGV